VRRVSREDNAGLGGRGAAGRAIVVAIAVTVLGAPSVVRGAVIWLAGDDMLVRSPGGTARTPVSHESSFISSC
jgi:hypothetical protein